MKKIYFNLLIVSALFFINSKILGQEKEASSFKILGTISANLTNKLLEVEPKSTSKLMAPSITPITQTICSGIAITDITTTTPQILGANVLDCVTGGTPTFVSSANNGIYFDITNSGTVPLRVNGFRYFTYAATATASTINQVFTAYKTTTATTAVGNYNTEANWTSLGTATYTLPASAANSGFILDTFLNDNGFTLAPGASVGIYIFCNNALTTDWKLGYRSTSTTGTPISNANITVTHRTRGDGFFVGGTTLRGFYGHVLYQTETFGTWTRSNTTNLVSTTTAGNTFSGFNNAVPFPITGTLVNTTTSQQTATYTVVSYDVNGVKDTQTIDVVVNPTPINTVTDNGGGSFTANQAGANYQWIDCGTNGPISGAINQTYVAPSFGNYKVIVTLNGCEIESACQSFLSTEDFDVKNALQVYPNPSKDRFSIISNYDFSFKLVNQIGQTLQLFSSTSNIEKTIEISHLSKGIYFLNGTTSEGNTISKKIIIE
jgi:Secretion system C-terminal sorting domain